MGERREAWEESRKCGEVTGGRKLYDLATMRSHVSYESRGFIVEAIAGVAFTTLGG
jgi:hypothetical protein